MGRDNSPKIRQRADLERKLNRRASYDRILIVCEGEKTEPLYFDEIKQTYKLSTANICILHGAYGTQPQKIVDYAHDKCLKSKEWEHVYCVFDRDDHPNFNNALVSTLALDKKYRNDLRQPIRFEAIPSIPSFELWLLLHYECITREIDRNEVMRLLRRPSCLPDYAKGAKGLFGRTSQILDTAFSNVQVLAREQARHGCVNPSTSVDRLVRRLIEIGKR